MGAGEWDYLGSSTFYQKSRTFYSGGRDLGIQIKQPYIGNLTLKTLSKCSISSSVAGSLKLK